MNETDKQIRQTYKGICFETPDNSTYEKLKKLFPDFIGVTSTKEDTIKAIRSSLEDIWIIGVLDRNNWIFCLKPEHQKDELVEFLRKKFQAKYAKKLLEFNPDLEQAA